MSDTSKVCSGCCSFFSIVWGFVCAGLAIHELRQTRVDFEDILNSIPEPQIRIVNDEKFLGPVHIICSPQMLQNYTNATCSDIFNSYKSITSTQQYFSWLYLDVSGNPITDTTIHDMIRARLSLFRYFAIAVIMGCIGKISAAIAKCVIDEEQSHSQKAFGAIFAISNAIFGIHIMHMFMCNLFSISEDISGVYLLEYVPAWAYWSALIVVFAVPLVLACCAGCFVAICDCDEETAFGWALVGLCLFTLAFAALWQFSAYGLFVYIWDFNSTFQAKSVGNSIVILKPEYINSLHAVKKIATAVGCLAIYDVIVGIFSACV